MGKLSTIFAALFCATAPLASLEVQEPKTEVTESRINLGKEMVRTVRSAYENGKYNPFLSEMDASYKEADLKGLIEMRQKDVPVDFQEEWAAKFDALQKVRNQELLNVISDKDDSPFAQKVRSVATNISTPEQEKALSKLNSFIVVAPGKGANEDENALINIDIEYEYKLLHAAADHSKEHQLALRMEKMDKMLAASKNFQDLSLKGAVGLASSNLDARLARNLDGVDLNQLAKNKPSNKTEESVYAIISSYQGQFSDLMKQIDHVNR